MSCLRSSTLLDMSPADREKEEALDYPFLRMLEGSLLPVLGYPEMSDETLQALAEILHAATRLWTRSADSDEVEVLPRERFHYWCFDLLFIITSRHSIGEFCFSKIEARTDHAGISGQPYVCTAYGRVFPSVSGHEVQDGTDRVPRGFAIARRDAV